MPEEPTTPTVFYTRVTGEAARRILKTGFRDVDERSLGLGMGIPLSARRVKINDGYEGDRLLRIEIPPAMRDDVNQFKEWDDFRCDWFVPHALLNEIAIVRIEEVDPSYPWWATATDEERRREGLDIPPSAADEDDELGEDWKRGRK